MDDWMVFLLPGRSETRQEEEQEQEKEEEVE